jgi:hypothetical protein
MTNLLPAWAEIDNFLGAGGTSVYMKNPTETDIAPYVSYLTGHQNANLDPFMGKYYTMALFALDEATKDTYPNPQLLIALNAQGGLCSVLFFYEVTDKETPFNWVDVWASDGTVGAGPLIKYLLGDKTGKTGYNLCNNPLPTGKSNMELLPYFDKDPSTKWFTLTTSQIIALILSQKEAALATENFSKLFQQSLVWAEPLGTN